MSEDELPPEGWVDAKLLEVLDYEGGAQPPKSTFSYEPRQGYVRLLQIRDFGEKPFPTYVADSSRLKKATAEDILLARYGGGNADDTLGRVCTGMAGAYNVALAKLVFPRDLLWRGYVAAFFRGPWFRNHVDRNSRSCQAGFNRSDLADLHYPLPPLAEQRRIVEKVEVLLAEVNAARARLAKVPTILKRFRQSILSAACSGRLTEDWRAASYKSDETAELLASLRDRLARPATISDDESLPDLETPDEWPVVRLALLTERITSGSRAWSRYYRDDAPATFVMAQNVRALRFDRSTRQGVAPPANDPERERTRVKQDDILVTIVGANTGDVCRVASPVEDHYVCQSVALMRPKMPETSPFLELFLNSTSHGRGQYLDLMYGEGRPHLSLDHLRNTAVALPSLPEQHEIVHRVDAMFKLADAIEARVAAASARADKLTQAILAKAFRGELVPTEAELARQESRDYEPASALLARIRATRAGNDKKPTRHSRTSSATPAPTRAKPSRKKSSARTA
jgi:type I restriction enzyme S subunit